MISFLFLFILLLFILINSFLIFFFSKVVDFLNSLIYLGRFFNFERPYLVKVDLISEINDLNGDSLNFISTVLLKIISQHSSF